MGPASTLASVKKVGTLNNCKGASFAEAVVLGIVVVCFFSPVLSSYFVAQANISAAVREYVAVEGIQA